MLCCTAEAVSSPERALERLFMDFSMKPYNICAQVCVSVHESERKIKRGKGIMGAVLQYHLYANLLSLW